MFKLKNNKRNKTIKDISEYEILSDKIRLFLREKLKYTYKIIALSFIILLVSSWLLINLISPKYEYSSQDKVYFGKGFKALPKGKYYIYVKDDNIEIKVYLNNYELFYRDLNDSNVYEFDSDGEYVIQIENTDKIVFEEYEEEKK